MMAVGGNGRARQFFRQHGWTETGSDKIAGKYTSRAASLYRQQIARDAANYDPQDFGASPRAAESDYGKFFAETSGTLSFPKDEPAATPKDTPKDAPKDTPKDAPKDTPKDTVSAHSPPHRTAEAISPSPVPETATTQKKIPTKSKLIIGGPKKGGSKSGKKLGLVKKVESQVDDSLFSQAPEKTPVFEDPVQSLAADSAPAGKSAGSRFDYDSMVQEASPPSSKTPIKRGKDGHLTLDSDGDFFSGSSFRTSAAATSSATMPPATPPVDYSKYGNAKSISSDAFFGEGTDNAEKANLTSYSGASAISSAQFFNDGTAPSGPAASTGVSGAEEMMSRLGVQVQQDLNQVYNAANDLGRKLGNFVSSLNKY